MTFNIGQKCTTNEGNANHLKSIFKKINLSFRADNELRQARKLRFILFNMDFKWLALLSFICSKISKK